MKRSTILSTLVLASAFLLPAVASAQASPAADDRSVMDTSAGDDDSGRWGWLGLLGLAGLMGLRRGERDKRRDLGSTRQPV